jgi:hypothetical protein
MRETLRVGGPVLGTLRRLQPKLCP